jgi:hypothetical protein
MSESVDGCLERRFRQESKPVCGTAHKAKAPDSFSKPSNFHNPDKRTHRAIAKTQDIESMSLLVKIFSQTEREFGDNLPQALNSSTGCGRLSQVHTQMFF